MSFILLYFNTVSHHSYPPTAQSLDSEPSYLILEMPTLFVKGTLVLTVDVL